MTSGYQFAIQVVLGELTVHHNYNLVHVMLSLCIYKKT